MTREEILQIAKPVLFNTEMLKAILDGRKTVTRRCVKFLAGKNPNWTGYIKDGLMLYNGMNEPCCRKAPYKLGDVLYIRETWSINPRLNMYGNYYYKANKYAVAPDGTKWKPSIHMPKEAARIFLKVKDVRVERLQEITTQQILSEGINISALDLPHTGIYAQFKQLWDSTIKKKDIGIYGWDANPYVWVIEFEKMEV